MTFIHEQLALPVQRQRGLLRQCLHSHEPRARLLHRQPDGSGVGGVGLVAGYERPHSPGVDQSHAVALRRQLARPVMRPTASLDADQAWRTVGEVLQHLGPLELHVDDLARGHVHRVKLKHALGDVQAHDMSAVDQADDLPRALCCSTIHLGPSMVFVKTSVYHAPGTSMPYPFEGPPCPAGKPASTNSRSAHLRAPALSFPVGREASITSPTRSRPRETLVACAAIAAILLTLIAMGHDGRRIAQLFALALPALAWMAWPVKSVAVHRLRSCMVWLTAIAIGVDGVARGYLLDAYQAAPDSALVLGASANSNAREGGEYLATHWRSLAIWSAVLAISAAILGRYAFRGARSPARQSRWTVALLAVTLLIGGVAHASKPWRRLHPVVFWTNWAQSVQTLRAGWADQRQERERALARARAVAPVVSQDGPATVVLVITDSINRDNMALYGYRRATTPHLLAHKTQLQEQMLVMRNAWSVDASTLRALRNMFNFGLPQSNDPQHVLALARAAGYKVWWMSNHDDVAIEQQHARLADVVDMVNRTPGRSAASLDGELLDCLQEALEDAARRKLIVVHP